MFRFAYRRYKLPFRQPVRTAHGLWTEREGLLLRLENAAGVASLAEVAPIPWFGTESVDEAETVCRELGAEIGETAPAALPERCICLRYALSAALQQSTEPSLEGKKALPVAALLSAGRAALAQIEPKAEAGFRVFKWKVGVGDLADELAMLDDLLAKLPDGAKLRLDANGAWDRRKAERWLERCADRPVEFIEQPCHATTSQDTARVDDTLLGLAHDYPTPIALDESLVSSGDVSRWVERGWPGIFVIKPVLLGEARATIERLEKAKAAVVFSSALETAVGAKAALRLAFSFGGESRALGFGVWPLFEDSRFDGPYQAPFIRAQDVLSINEEAVWNALS
ncbi:MAG: o-succinylbenzoate synthase [Nibricoccus sp.]